MPSAKKKKQQARKQKKAGGFSAAAGQGNDGKPKLPRTNDQIVGKSWVNRPSPPPAVLRELEEALMYEVTSSKRREIIAAVEALSENQAEGSEGGEVLDIGKLPITYESKGMLDMPGGSCLLSYGKVSPFDLQKQHPSPSLALKYAAMTGDEEEMVLAKRWTGEHPIVRVHFDVIKHCLDDKTNRCDMTLFVGECWLQKTDLWQFAGKFRGGCSPYIWPDYFAVLQCPFCCKMATPCDPGNGVEPIRRIMLMTNIAQFTMIDGRANMPHRALPRLCCESCFVSNLKSSDEPALGPDGWKSYPQILEEGIAFTAAKDLMEKSMQKSSSSRKGGSEWEQSKCLPTAWTLYTLYDECGMCAAVSGCIQESQMKLFQSVSRK